MQENHDHPALQTLLRLKQHETPGPEFFEGMLTEFHRRQRLEVVKKSAWSIFQDQMEAFVVSTRETLAQAVFSPRSALVGACAALTVTVAILSLQREPSAEPVSQSPVLASNTTPTSPFFTNDGIAADLARPLQARPVGGLVFDRDLSRVPALASVGGSLPHVYVAEALPASTGSARVSF